MGKLLSLLICLVVSGAVAVAQNAVPEVIPALQQWKGRSGVLVMQEKGRIVVDPKQEAELKTAAEQLSADLKEMFGFDYEVVAGKAGKGDISLRLSSKPDEKLGEEGYVLDITSKVEMEAPTAKGVFWATRTLLQMMYNQPKGLVKGKAVDYPLYAKRGFMLDVGRKFFSMDYLKQYVKILSFYKFNEFQIHLNDNAFPEFYDYDWNKTYSAFRLECESFPGLTARDGSYTKEEFKEFQRMANRYGIDVIPEIDVPAHSLAFTHYNPRLAADNKEYGQDHLDLYKQEVYDFVDTLFAEYIKGDDPTFIGEYVHIGTDEYNRKEAEQFRRFTDRYLKYIKSLGKTPRMWGSLKTMKGETPVEVDNVYVNSWNHNWFDIQTANKAGYKFINTCDHYLYIVPAVNYYHDFLDSKWLYENWTPNKMMKTEDLPADTPNLEGAMFAVWNDRVGNGITEQDVHYRSFPAVQVVAEKTWKGDNAKNVSFEQFDALCKRMPEAPGVNLLARIDGTKKVTEPGVELQLDGTTVHTTEVAEVGYPYSVEFELRQGKEPMIDAILFRGPHSEFISNWNDTRKFAFRRENYEFVFHDFRMPEEEWVKIRVEGDHKGTSLYVNGQLVERLEGRKRMVYNKRFNRKDYNWYQETLIFPLQQIGDANQGFTGTIKNVVCTQTK